MKLKLSWLVWVLAIAGVGMHCRSAEALALPHLTVTLFQYREPCSTFLFRWKNILCIHLEFRAPHFAKICSRGCTSSLDLADGGSARPDVWLHQETMNALITAGDSIAQSLTT